MSMMNDKITFFSKIIYEKIDEENRKLSDSFKIEKEKKISELEKELKKKRSRELAEALKEVQFKANEITAKEKLISRQQIIVLRDNLILKTVDNLRCKFLAFTETPEYEDFLLKLVIRTIMSLEGTGYRIYLTENDFKKYGQKIKELAATKLNSDFEIKIVSRPIIGGAIVEEKNGRFMLDNSFSSLIEDNKAKIGFEVSETFK